MKAVAVLEQGTPPRLVDLPKPEPGPGKLLVKMQVAGLNPFDGKRASGRRGDLALPFVAGTDGAGIVEAVGPGVTKFSVGDRVFGRLGDAAHGTYAEYSVTAEDGVVARIPDEVDTAVAAAIPVAGLAAFGLLRAMALSPGDNLLIVGATGGVGSFLVQLAAKAGLDVIATARPELAARMQQLGARLTVDHTSTTRVAQQLAVQGIDHLQAVADLAGARELVEALADVIVPGGTAGSTAGGVDEEKLAAWNITAFNFRRQATAAELEQLGTMVANGELRVVIDRELTLADAPEALQESTRNHLHGKTVLRIDAATSLGDR
jgi:NADPH:quinone reductase-like Zn-dependent oxidoreductase